ncbi:hypothetical protein F4802DRAFT_597336 [Xylaria palmicola]|nr:hypothetical protein F4802DRAFT_597336 [Xylaria palmicola]
MFAIPEAKRVRRKDLYDSASSSDDEAGPDPQTEAALRAKLNAQLSGLLDFSFTVAPAPEQQRQQQEEADPGAADSAGDAPREGEEPPAEEAFAFRLFRDEAPTRTVVLADDDPAALGDGGLVVPSRPRSYYVASPPSPGRTSEYRSVAVSAEYLLADAKKRRWGLEKPWRVIHIMLEGSVPGAPAAGAEDDEKKKKTKKRTRPGKRHRILLRVKEKAAREREDAAKKATLEKEEHLQEKKKRLNRERKLKRRQKEREKKAGAQAKKQDDSIVDDSSLDGDDKTAGAPGGES